MIIKKEFDRVSNLIQGNKVYFNPSYYKKPKIFFDLCPLIFNKTLIYITKNNVSQSIFPRVKEFKEEGFLIAVSISEKTLPENIYDDKCILRTQILDEKLFDKNYKEAIEEDQNNPEFIDLIRSIIKAKNNKEINSIIDSFSFAINWDLLFMQMFKVPMYSPTKYKPIISYKLTELSTNIYSPKRAQNAIEICKFLEKINIIFPSKLTIDQIKSFRKDKAAIHFRNWLERKLINVEDDKSNIKIEHLVQEFNKLTKSYGKKGDFISASMGGIIGTVLGGPIGTAIGAGAGYGLSSLFNYLWKIKGPNRWVFLLTDFKKADSL